MAKLPSEGLCSCPPENRSVKILIDINQNVVASKFGIECSELKLKVWSDFSQNNFYSTATSWIEYCWCAKFCTLQMKQNRRINKVSGLICRFVHSTVHSTQSLQFIEWTDDHFHRNQATSSSSKVTRRLKTSTFGLAAVRKMISSGGFCNVSNFHI